MKVGNRCVDCEFAVRKQQAGTEDPLMTRIRASAPPAAAIDVVDDLEDDDQDADESDAELLELDRELHTAVPPPPPKRRGRKASPFNAFKPGTRQPAPAAAKPTGEPPWWAKAKPGEMTKTAEGHRQRMAGSKEAKKVPGFVND